MRRIQARDFYVMKDQGCVSINLSYRERNIFNVQSVHRLLLMLIITFTGLFDGLHKALSPIDTILLGWFDLSSYMAWQQWKGWLSFVVPRQDSSGRLAKRKKVRLVNILLKFLIGRLKLSPLSYSSENWHLVFSYFLRYYFLCGQWLAVDEGDCLIYKVLPVASREEVTGFGQLFFDHTRRKLFDEHLWLSVIGRPVRSNFTRLQRLSTILCLLFTTMISNAMWYGRANIEHDRIIKVGPLTLSAATLLVSLFGSLTVIPVNTLIVTLFRKHRPKDWPTDDTLVSTVGSQQTQDKKKKKWWKEKYPLPFWCAYIAWALVVAFTLTSMLFIIFYSAEWGKEKSEEWLSSLVLSVIESVLLFQPLKVGAFMSPPLPITGAAFLLLPVW